MKYATLVVALIALAGCATTDGSSVETTFSRFDNSRHVSISSHGNACAGVLCTGLGAQWSSVRPDDALLTVRVFNEIVEITGAQLSIDGSIEKLDATGVTNFDNSSRYLKQSQKAFAVRLDTLRKVVVSKKTWLRVQTPSGYIEDPVIDGERDSKAFHALKRFLAAVDQKAQL